MSTTFCEVHTVTAEEDILMKKFASKLHRYYDPQDGFGYYHATGELLDEIQLHKKVILMDKVKRLNLNLDRSTAKTCQKISHWYKLT